MVMAQSLFKTLKHRHPEVEIDVLAPSWSEPLLARMPEIHTAVNLPVGHGRLGLAARWRLGRRLNAQHYDQAIIVPRSLKAAFIPFVAGIPVRTGYRGEHRYGIINDMRSLDRSVLRQTVQRYVALGEAAMADQPPKIFLPELQTKPINAQRLRDQLGLHNKAPVIGFLPGAEYGPAKQWPVDYFTELAARQNSRGRQVWIFGSERDRPTAEEIAGRSGTVVSNLCGKTRLEDAVDLLSCTQAVATNDSGLMHVAAAVGVPVVAMYGSSTPDYTPPLSKQATVLYEGLDCSPCFKRHCPLGHTNCLKQISVDRVDDALNELMVNH